MNSRFFSLLVLLKAIWFTYIAKSIYLPSKSIRLTPSYKEYDGVSVVTLKDVIIKNNEWRINTTSNTPSNLLINLDKTWAFYPNGESTVIITINGYSITSDNLDFISIFSVNNAYFATKISLDNTQNNQIFPICDIKPIPTANMSNSDISSLQIDNITYSNMKLSQFSNGYTNIFPLQYTIKNAPNTHSTFISYKSVSWTNFAQFCGFQSFESDKGLKIYITGDDIGQQFVITSIDITYSIPYLTYSPSVIPTESPSISEPIFFNNTAIKTDEMDEISDNTPNLLFKYILLGLAASICICLICVLYILLKKRIKKKQKPRVPQRCAVPSNSVVISPKSHTNITDLSPSTASYSKDAVSPTTDNINEENKLRSTSIFIRRQLNEKENIQKNSAVSDPLEHQINKYAASQSYPPANLTSKDKQRSVLSDRSETFIPPPPSQVFRSEFNKGLDKTIDAEDDLLDGIVNDMAASQLQLNINKNFLSAAQREYIKSTPK